MEFRVVGIGIRIWKLELAETRPRLGRDHGRDIAMCEPRHQIKHKKRHFDTKKDILDTRPASNRRIAPRLHSYF